MGESKRTMLVLAHTGRENALSSARQAINQLTAAGVAVRVTEEEAPALACSGADVLPAGPAAAEGAELVLVLGGDGSLLRAAELARPAGTPLIGVNLGHVGFLAEAEPDGLTETVERLVAGDYRVEERMTLEVVVSCEGTEFARGWALTEVEALLMVPLAAHALFARPIVVSPRSVIAVELVDGRGEASGHEADHAVIWCDGRRKLRLPPGARIEVRRGTLPVLLARVHGDPRGEFTGRLVAKFGLPVKGWRGRSG